jgi:guanylate kinase
VYLAEQEDGKLNVIDGQQRLTALLSFIDGKFSVSHKSQMTFNLIGLSKLQELNGKKFNELEKHQQLAIKRYPLRVITFSKESDKDLQFEIFARLNRGAVALNEQELRNCIYRGRFNNLIKELAENEDFKYLFGLTEPHKRMIDRELVLRFAAFFFNSYTKYNPPIKKFLNDTMSEYKNIDEKNEQKLKNTFNNSISIIRSMFDNKAFKRFKSGNEKEKSGNWEARVNIALFDVLMFSFADLDKKIAMQNLDAIREAFIYLMTNDEEFINSIEKSTSNKKVITIRFEKWLNTLNDIIEVGQKEPRCFSRKLKEEFYEKDPTCAICGNRIENIDDAAMDHIEQYWLGGKTIPENARLTHRYCNNARARKE